VYKKFTSKTGETSTEFLKSNNFYNLTTLPLPDLVTIHAYMFTSSIYKNWSHSRVLGCQHFEAHCGVFFFFFLIQILQHQDQRNHLRRCCLEVLVVEFGVTVILSALAAAHLLKSGEETSSLTAFCVDSLVNFSHESFENFLLSGVVWKVDG